MNTKRSIPLAITAYLVLAGSALIGCGESVDPNAVKNPSADEMNAAKNRRDEVLAIQDRAGGVWEKMTPEDKKRLLELSANNEAMARQGWEAMKMLPRK